jgi:hypothetical protein
LVGPAEDAGWQLEGPVKRRACVDEDSEGDALDLFARFVCG